jgi:RNA polymerase sigma-70 factor (ECF subfamily)
VTPEPPIEPDDAALVHQFQGGLDEAFMTLMGRHERRVYNLAYRMLGDTEDARDATQEAFLSCFRNLSSFRGEAAFSTWLHRIAVNACYDSLRRRRDTASLDATPIEPSPHPDHADRADTALDVQRALLSVPPDFRAVLVMHEVQDMPVEDVAEVLGLPVGTVKSRLHRARVALARALTPEVPREPEAAPTPSNPTNP